nr:putative metabolite transport protein [Quercus suber]
MIPTLLHSIINRIASDIGTIGTIYSWKCRCPRSPFLRSLRLNFSLLRPSEYVNGRFIVPVVYLRSRGSKLNSTCVLCAIAVDDAVSRDSLDRDRAARLISDGRKTGKKGSVGQAICNLLGSKAWLCRSPQPSELSPDFAFLADLTLHGEAQIRRTVRPERHFSPILRFCKGTIMAEGKPLDTSPHLTELDEVRPEATEKSRWDRIWPTLACGAGLFSDGYLQSAIGPVNTVLGIIYGDAYKKSAAQQNVSSIAFAGTVVGQLAFGYTSDHYSRKWSLLVSTVILFIFAALSAGAYGAGGTPGALFAALTAYRFLLVGRWFRRRFVLDQVLSHYVISALTTSLGNLMPMIIAAAAPNNLGLIWRLSLGLGVIFPLSLIYFRFKLQEPESVSRNNFRKVRTPYWLALKFYGPRLLLVCGIWFIYDFLTYPFSIYSTTWINVIQPDRQLWQTFGWGTLINFFYLPGAIIGAFVSDWIGPRKALAIFVIAQGCVGFIMSGCYGFLQKPEFIGAFVVVYGIFLMLGEIGPGDNIGLVASKTSAAGIRGQYYAIAAAFGKIGGLVGSYVFPVIESDGGGPDTVLGGQLPFYVASALCFVSAFLVLLLPEITQDTIAIEDLRFKEYLIAHGFDIGKMGGEEWQETRHSMIEETKKQ